MNRENKFRGKRLENGKWVYGDLLHPITSCRIVNYTEVEDDDGISVDYHYYDVDSHTTGQYVGLKDKNVTEIYEGDILLSYGVKYMVVYTCGAFMGCPISNFGRTGSLWSLVTGYAPCEIIGNIYDNPELLKS